MQTTLCCSGQAFATIILLFFGLIAASIHLQNQSSQLSSSIVAPPMIAMAKRQGPWPDCLGVTSDNCKDLIRSTSSGDFEIVVVLQGSEVSSTFEQNRVQIFVDESGIVKAIPKRG